ncbi:MAG: thiolase family protein [Promethearchaeia archaeon]
MIKEKIAIIGIGDLPVGKYPEYDEMELASLAISRAINDSGLKKEQIEGFFAGPDNVVADMFFTAWLAEKLRLEPKRMAEIACGGASGTLALNHAINEVLTGKVENALVFSTSRDASQMYNMGHLFMKFYARALGEDLPFGAQVFGYYAMAAQRYMHEYGATEEDFALVAVKNRRFASKNPNAMMRSPLLTVEDVLKSPSIAPPFNRLDCCPWADGAAAVLITHEDNARRLEKNRACSKPVYISGYGEKHDSSNFIPEKKPISTIHAARPAMEEALKSAGITIEDIDVAELYDAFTSCEIILSEDLGFFEKGEGYKALRRGETDLNGKIPINTSGGRLSLGHPAYVTALLMHTHMVRQLRGEAGENQVEGAKIALTQVEHGMNNGIAITILEVE